MVATIVLALIALGHAACRTSLQQRSAVRMGAGPPPERDSSARRAVLRDAAGLALGTALGGTLGPLPALAGNNKGRASSQGSQVNKDPQSLLRLGLPIDCPAARALQQDLEELRGNAQKSLWSKAVSNAKSARSNFASKRSKLLAAVAEQNKAAAQPLLETLATQLDKLEAVVQTAKLEDTIAVQDAAVTQVGLLEELMVPKFPFQVPKEFDGLPRLYGRASVEVTVKRGPDAEEPTFNVNGELIPTIVTTLILDGYNAPLTAGNFLELCSKGFYDGMQIQRSDGFVVQTGDPRGIEGADDTKPVGYVVDGKLRKIPLEVFPAGGKEPIYGATFDDEGYGGAASTLPFNAYGALGMAREEYEADSASSQWFWLLFDSDLTPAGKNLLDGRYSCFGYTVRGEEGLRPVRVGDIIVSAKVKSGMDKLAYS